MTLPYDPNRVAAIRPLHDKIVAETLDTDHGYDRHIPSDDCTEDNCIIMEILAEAWMAGSEDGFDEAYKVCR